MCVLWLAYNKIMTDQQQQQSEPEGQVRFQKYQMMVTATVRDNNDWEKVVGEEAEGLDDSEDQCKSRICSS